MKKLFVPLALFFLIYPVKVFAYEKISNYRVDLKMNKDASVEISEEIVYDFAGNSRHGIYRYIPYKYKTNAGTHNLEINNVRVEDNFGILYPFSKNFSSGILQIKIGDPDKLVSGQKNYIINYDVKGSINYFEDYDELYWNAIGTDWAVPISEVLVVADLTDVSAIDDVLFDCFIGLEGSQQKCKTEIVPGEKIFFSANDLNSYEGLTIVVG